MNDAVSPPRRKGRPASASADSAGGEVQSLDRAITILEILHNDEGVTLSDVARRAELPTSTVHRLLTTMQRRGLVKNDAESGLWTVGLGLFRFGSAYLRIRKLPDIGRPVLRELFRDAEETVNLSMVDDSDLVCVAQVESHAPVRAFFRAGRSLPMHASAAGKAILAAMNEEARARWLGPGALERFTTRTLNTRIALLAELAAIGERGWAIDDQEHTLGMRCVAAAIFNEWREPVGAVSVSAPEVRMSNDSLPQLGKRVKAAADQLTLLYAGQSAAQPEPL